jgi:hypothetical protein
MPILHFLNENKIAEKGVASADLNPASDCYHESSAIYESSSYDLLQDDDIENSENSAVLVVDPLYSSFNGSSSDSSYINSSFYDEKELDDEESDDGDKSQSDEYSR